MSMTNARNAAARGAALLDQHRPGWHNNINLDTLNMASCSNCVVGQTFGGWTRGCEEMDIVGRSADYGFDTNSLSTYDELTDAWRELIERRRQEPEPLAQWERELLSEPVETAPAEPTFSLTRDQLVSLVKEAMDTAYDRGAHTELGLVVNFLDNLA